MEINHPVAYFKGHYAMSPHLTLRFSKKSRNIAEWMRYARLFSRLLYIMLSPPFLGLFATPLKRSVLFENPPRIFLLMRVFEINYVISVEKKPIRALLELR